MRLTSFKKFMEGEYDQFQNDSGKPFWGNKACGALICAKDTGRLLLLYRSKYVNEPHQWGGVSGKVDNESASNYQAEVSREIEEEVGFSGSVQLHPAYIFRTQGFEFRNFIGVVEHEFEPHLNWENEKYQWVKWEELQTLTPKHFGLEALLKNSGKQIESIITQMQSPQGNQPTERPPR